MIEHLITSTSLSIKGDRSLDKNMCAISVFFMNTGDISVSNQWGRFCDQPAVEVGAVFTPITNKVFMSIPENSEMTCFGETGITMTVP